MSPASAAETGATRRITSCIDGPKDGHHPFNGRAVPE